MDNYSFQVKKDKGAYLPQVEQFVATAKATYRTTSTKDGTVFNMQFNEVGAMDKFKKDFSVKFPFLYGI